MDRPATATRNQPFFTKVSAVNTATSADNTALTAVYTLIANACSDAITFATVFDEVRCVKIEHHLHYGCVITATSVPAGPNTRPALCLAYDPSNAGAYSSVTQALEAPYRTPPYAIGYEAFIGPKLVKEQTLRHPVPKTVGVNLATGLIGSNWVSPSDTGAINGYLKPYGDAAGAGFSIWYRTWSIFYVEYAYRT